MVDPTVQVPLGSTGLSMSRIGIGMRALGELPDGADHTAHAVVRRAAELGVTYFDTAPSYGHGKGERRLGDVLEELPSRVISTKAGRAPVQVGLAGKVRHVVETTVRSGPRGMLELAGRAGAFARKAASRGSVAKAVDPIEVHDFSYDATMRSVEQSLRRLRTDRVDILYIHDPVEPLPDVLDGTYRALARLRNDGTIRAIGVSANETGPLLEYARAAQFDVLMVAGRYSLVDQSAADELLPFVADEPDTALVVAGVFNGGFLADPVPGGSFDYRAASAERLTQARAVHAVCRRHGVDPRAAAIGLAFASTAVTTVLVGVDSVEQLEQNLGLLEEPIPPELWADLHAEGHLSSPAMEELARADPNVGASDAGAEHRVVPGRTSPD